jgi:hypothetical protein
MKKLLLSFGATLLFLNLSNAKADDTVSVLVGTQTYQCTTAGGLKCNAVNSVQQQQMTIKKNGGKIQIADSARNLSADISTSVDNNEMSYDVAFCSKTVCTQSSSNGGAVGYINQTMFGQYNLTESSFYVLGFFISSQNKALDLETKAAAHFSALSK